MPRGEYLGEFEQMVMLAVARLGDGAYGMAILDEIHARTGADAAVASVYAALDRLERRGYVASSIGAPTPERGGRAKRYFKIEPAAIRLLREAQRTWAQMTEGLDDVIGT